MTVSARVEELELSSGLALKFLEFPMAEALLHSALALALAELTMGIEFAGLMRKMA